MAPAPSGLAIHYELNDEPSYQEEVIDQAAASWTVSFGEDS